MKAEKIMGAMICYNGDDVRRIGHALKVYAYAEAIGGIEGLSGEDMLILRLAAVLHDIGIHECERKYGSTAGSYQQIEGPPIARRMLQKIGASEKIIDRVCFLIAHHHTYTDVDGIDYQILIEADFLVNAQEDGMSHDAVEAAVHGFFRTKTGTRFAQTIYLS